MKFCDLRPGDHFEHKGQRFQKTGLLVAINLDSKKQTFFNRSSPVSACTETTQPTQSAHLEEANIDLKLIMQALENYHQKSVQIIHQLDLSEEDATSTVAQLEQIKADFIAALKV